MSNDRYTGSTFDDLIPTNPEDVDDIGWNAAALRQIKRYLKLDEGLTSWIIEQLESEENNAIKEAFDAIRYVPQVGEVYMTFSDFDPNTDQLHFQGTWKKLSGTLLMATGTTYTYPLNNSSYVKTFWGHWKNATPDGSDQPSWDVTQQDTGARMLLKANASTGWSWCERAWSSAHFQKEGRQVVRCVGNVTLHGLGLIGVTNPWMVTRLVPYDDYDLQGIDLVYGYPSVGTTLSFDLDVDLNRINGENISLTTSIGTTYMNNRCANMYGSGSTMIDYSVSCQIIDEKGKAVDVISGGAYTGVLPYMGCNIWHKTSNDAPTA